MKAISSFAAGTTFLALAVAAFAGPVPGQGTWETTLLGRDLGGDGIADAFYDADLNITWLRNVNVNGSMHWADAMDWSASLDVSGTTGWRLPGVRPVNGIALQEMFSNNGSTDIGYAKSGAGWGAASEIGHLFYVSLGNKGNCTPDDAAPQSCVEQAGFGLTNTGDFVNLQGSTSDGSNYWTSQPYITDYGQAYSFNMFYGLQYANSRDARFFAMAVHDGDVGTPIPSVPEPATYALALAGLGVLGAVTLRRMRASK